MSSSQAASSSIQNRSPFVVTVRTDVTLNRRFSFTDRKKAQTYVEALADRGIKARLTQLETSFQLRVRRKGVPEQFITFDTFEAAEQTRLHIEAQLSVSVVRDYSVATKTTLRDLLERYLEQVVPSHKGASIERTRIRRLLREEAFVDKKLAALTTEDLQDFITDRLTEVAPATVDRELDMISQTLNYADDVWKIAPVESPFKGLRRPKYFNERDRRLAPSEEKELLEAARADENPYVEPAIVLALETAMRRSELLGLAAADINFELRYAFLRDTKNGRSRKVPLSMRALQVIRALLALQNLSENDDSTTLLLPLTPNALKKAFFNRVIPKSRVVDFHFHDLRHEAISRLAESERFGLLELQAISGHRDVRMLQRYAHLCAGSLATKMDEVRGSTTEYTHRGRRRTVFKPEEIARSLPPAGSGTTPVTPAPVAEVQAAPETVSTAVTPTIRTPSPAARAPAANVIDFRAAVLRRAACA
ncbi:putaive site-specific recombinase/integrase [Azoarcus sp. KH32C]|nr:putaive site-specific recombinase/integrase [Azoarcus sp. KH32C]